MSGPDGTKILIGIAVVVVVGAVGAGLVALGPPSEERARRLDERRVEDLRGIAGAVDLYWTRHGSLPASIQELSDESGVTISTGDPETGQDYELQLLETATYEVCASFERSSAEPRERSVSARDASENFWSHGAGRQCFRLDAQDVPSRARRQPPESG